MGDVALDHLTAFVKGYLASALAHVAVVGVGHLAGAVDDAAHDAYLQPFEVLGTGLDLLQGFLDVVLRASAGGTSDVFALADTCPHGLQDVVGNGDFLHGIFGEGDTDGVANAVDKQRPDACGTL